MKSVVRVIVAGMFLCAVPAFAETASSADTNMQILVQKLKADKKLLVAGNLELTDAESKGFWPLYDMYQKDLQQVNERLGKTISEYAEAYNQGKGTIANDTAKKLLNDVIVVEEKEVVLKREYADKIWQGAAGGQDGAVYPDRKQNPCDHQVRARATDSVGVLADRAGGVAETRRPVGQAVTCFGLRGDTVKQRVGA